MKRVGIIALLFSSTILSFQPVESISETFLVAYRQLFHQPNRDIALTYLMKLDPAGRIIMRPQRIASELNDSFGLFGLSWNRPGVNLWTSGRNPNFPSGPTYLTNRLIMNRYNFATMGTGTLSVKGAGLSFLSVTDKADENFILFEDKKRVSVIAVRLFPDGTKTGELWRLSHGSEQAHGPTAVSGDGRMAAWISSEHLVIQPLHKNGRPSKVRNVLHMNGSGIGSLAITNVLPGGKRYVLISAWDYNGVGSCSGARNRYVLLAIEDLTAKRISKTVDFQVDAACTGTLQVQMDPEGRFFIYTQPGFSRGKLNLNYPLLFQSLDSEGHRTGAVKPVADNAELGFSMLPN